MNKMRMKRLVLIITALTLLLAAGCGTPPEQTTSDSGNDKTKFRVVKDNLNREVEVPEHPERVLVLNSSMTETLFDLGVVPIGKVNEYMIPHPEASDLPDISFEHSPNMEVINKLAPDLIFAHTRHHGQLLDSLESTGAAVVFIDPSLGDDPLIGGVALMGKALNREEVAAAYLKKVEKKSAMLREKIIDSPIKTALFIQGGNESIMAAQSFCFWGRLLSYLGIENIVPERLPGSSKAGFIPFDIETIIQKDPDAILVLQPGFKSKSGQGQGMGKNKQDKMKKGAKKQRPAKGISPEELLVMYQNDPMWKQLTAVKEGHIVIVPGNIAPGKINVLDALEVTAKLINPEAF